jgi:hypothetical protein
MQWPIVVQGREVDEEKVGWLSGWVTEHRGWSRRKLAGELCVLWDWRDGRGRAKDLAARSFLLKMEERGWIVLPPLREVYRRPRSGIPLCASVLPMENLEASFQEVEPVSLEVVRAGTEAHRRWATYLTRHHYLGLRVVGQNMGYLARDRTGREVAALLFGAPAWRCAGRDAYLQERGFSREKELAGIANNTRFLIFPWVKVPHLASHILGAAARRIDGDWREKYGQGLVWLETFVERGRFLGTCYRAANWVQVGSTRGRGRQDRQHTASVPEKDVYLFRIKA